MKIEWDIPAVALEKWDRTVVAKKADNQNAVDINIYSTIGEFGDGQGMTAKIVSSILRKADGADIVVNINSGGGDFFEGIAIHTLLSEYSGSVTTNVVGLAASAASIVAVAGDTVNIAESGFFMIHNAWTMAIGNKNDMQDVADMLTKFDTSMNAIYSKKTGYDEKQIKKMMDAETWLGGQEAIDASLADNLLGSELIDKTDVNSYIENAVRRVENELAKVGMPRSERRALLKQIKEGTQDAAPKPTHDAGQEKLVSALSELLAKFNTKKT